MALVSLSRFRDVNKFFADWNTNWLVTPLGEHPLANCHVEAIQFARGETWIRHKENLLGWSIPKPFPSITFYFSTATTLTICQTEHLEMRRTNGFSSLLYLWKFLITETMAAPGSQYVPAGFKLFLLLQVKTFLNLKCSEPDVSGLASRVEKIFSPELSLYSGGLLL